MKKKTPDYGHPAELFAGHPAEDAERETNPRFIDYCKKPTVGSRNKLVHDFYDAVIRKSFVLGTEGRFTFDEDSYTKNSLAFFEQVFFKVTIDTEENRCLTAQVMFADLGGHVDNHPFGDSEHAKPWNEALQEVRERRADDPGLDLADIGLDPKETSRIYAGMEKNSPSDKIDISKLHKCGEFHIPFDRHNKEDK